MEYDEDARPNSPLKVHPLLLSLEHRLNSLSTKTVSVGLHIGHNGRLQPVIKFTSCSDGWAVMDLAAWEDFQTHFTTITEYFTAACTGEDSMPLHTFISHTGYILSYANLDKKPVITIQNAFQHNGSYVQSSRPFFRFDNESFTKLIVLQSILSFAISSSHRIRDDAELCQNILINVIAANTIETIPRSVKNTIRTKRPRIRKIVQQRFRSASVTFHMGTQFRAALIEELLIFHLDYIISAVIMLKKSECTLFVK